MYLFPGRMCVPSTLSLDSRKSQQRRMPTLPLPCFTGTVKLSFHLLYMTHVTRVPGGSMRLFSSLRRTSSLSMIRYKVCASSHYSMSISLYWWLLVSFRIHYEAFHFKTFVGGQQGPEIIGEEEETSKRSFGLQDLHREHLCWQDGVFWKEH